MACSDPYPPIHPRDPGFDETAWLAGREAAYYSYNYEKTEPPSHYDEAQKRSWSRGWDDLLEALADED